MPVVHENKGEADLRGLTIIGVNVKDNDSAIGYFGRGFKDACGILLRNHHRLVVQVGLTTYEFVSRPTIIRGQEFGLVHLTSDAGEDRELGFTTDVAKDWKMWMAYRELYCNTLDEAGTTYATSTIPATEPNITRVIVHGGDYEEAHRDRRQYILQSSPLFESDVCNIHPGKTSSVFYRGIKVDTLESRSFLTYDIMEKVSLTEDRTLRFSWDAKNAIFEAISKLDSEKLIKDLASLPDSEWYETSEPFPGYLKPNDTFIEVVGEIVKNRLGLIPANFYEFWKRAVKDEAGPAPTTLDSIEQQTLEIAIDFCQRHGYPVDDYPLNFTDSLGSGHMACVVNDEIWISRECFGMGIKCVAHALIEEYIHRRYGIADFTREFQEHLFQKMLGLMEKLDGRPLG